MNATPDPKHPNLVMLERTGWAPTNKDVAATMREWADHIENSDQAFGTVVLVMEVNGVVCRRTIGGANDRVRVTGILFNAATRSVGECAGWGDDFDPIDDSA